MAAIALSLAAATSIRNFAYESQLTIWRDVTEKNPDNPRGWFNYGRALSSLAEKHRDVKWELEAMNAYRRAVETVRSNPTFDTHTRADAAYNLGNCHRRLGEAYRKANDAAQATQHFSKAADAYRIATDLEPRRPDYWSNLSGALAWAGRLDDAIAACTRAIEVGEERNREEGRQVVNTHEMHKNMALILIDRQRLPEAIDHFRKAIEIKPDYVDALAGAGHASLAAERPVDAVDFFEKALRVRPQMKQLESSLQLARQRAATQPKQR